MHPAAQSPNVEITNTNIVAVSTEFVYDWVAGRVSTVLHGRRGGRESELSWVELPKVLVVGSGAREHALAWHLARDGGTQVYAAPGNPGIASLARCLPIAATDLSALASAAAELRIDLTLVGPEAPLAAGLADAFAARHLALFGPTRQAAQLEASKVFAKTLMRRAQISTADFEVFDDPIAALAFVRRADRPLVIKADGLAAGKGVVVAENAADAADAVDMLMVRRLHGDAGARVVIEERLHGEEVSVLALVHGTRVWPLLPARDFKRAETGDTGPNTGGMGAIAPPALPAEFVDQVTAQILEPTASAMARLGQPFTGVLYAGIIITAEGPKVLEYNCRFGDPEAQVILPLLESALTDVLFNILHGHDPALRWSAQAAAGVVLASGGYPGAYRTGLPITGSADVPADILVFHAGTAMMRDELVTAGGRVLNVVARGASVQQASRRAYAVLPQIHFEAMQYRDDIGRPATAAALPLSPAIALGGV
jgi:phosphoribosylamine--glycine ligase